MDLEETVMTRFAARWARTTEAAVPSVDNEKGVERVLGARKVLDEGQPIAAGRRSTVDAKARFTIGATSYHDRERHVRTSSGGEH